LVWSEGEFVAAMIDPEMLVEAQLNEPVIASPTIGM
jgi:hypothetical protein